MQVDFFLSSNNKIEFLNPKIVISYFFLKLLEDFKIEWNECYLIFDTRIKK